MLTQASRGDCQLGSRQLLLRVGQQILSIVRVHSRLSTILIRVDWAFMLMAQAFSGGSTQSWSMATCSITEVAEWISSWSHYMLV